MSVCLMYCRINVNIEELAWYSENFRSLKNTLFIITCDVLNEQTIAIQEFQSMFCKICKLNCERKGIRLHNINYLSPNLIWDVCDCYLRKVKKIPEMYHETSVKPMKAGKAIQSID